MPQLLDLLERQLDDDTLTGMSRQIGADRDKTRQAASMLIPMLIGGLSQNTQGSPQGRQALASALERDHDGSLLDLAGKPSTGQPGGGGAGGAEGGLLAALGGLLGGSGVDRRAADGDGILEHLLGGRRQAVERGVGSATGLDAGAVQRLLTMLAPLVMSALGRVRKQDNLDADGIGELVDRERQDLEQRAPDTGQRRLHELLDSNRDGKVDLADDVAKVGMALGAALMLGKRRR